MKVDFHSTRITLDWDRLTFRHAVNAVRKFFREDPRIRHLELRQSPTNGFHVVIDFYKPVHVAWERRRLNDDGNRLIHDLLNPSTIHDILWTIKVLHGVRWVSVPVLTLAREGPPNAD